MDQKIIDFMVYHDDDHQGDSQDTLQKDELTSAIQELIRRLRESNPIRQISQ